jgi:hypothetical protein
VSKSFCLSVVLSVYYPRFDSLPGNEVKCRYHQSQWSEKNTLLSFPNDWTVLPERYGDNLSDSVLEEEEKEKKKKKNSERDNG